MHRPSISWGTVLACLAGVGLLFHARGYDYLSDDALIVARYARNAVAGHGWVYNLGERVEGYTSFLSLALTAALGALGIDFVVAVRGLSLAGALATVALAWGFAPALGIPRRSAWSAVAPALVAATGAVACWALGGLEACGFAALVLATTSLAASEPRRPALAGLVAGLTALMRPEGAILGVLGTGWVRLDEARGQWRRTLAFALPAVALPAAHLAWRLAYYGEWLPNTFYTKVGSSSAQFVRGWTYLSTFLADHGGALVWCLPVAAAFVGRGPQRRFARRLAAVLLALAAAVVFVGGDGLPMYRFWVPVVPLWALLFAAGLERLWRLGSARWPRRQWALGGLAAAVLGLVALPLALPDRQGSAYRTYAFQQAVELPRWRAAGEWLAANTPPAASVAVAPIGAIGYYSERPILDLLGLVDPHIAHRDIPLGSGWAGHEKHDGPYVLSRRPDYLLLGNVMVTAQPLPLDHPQFVRPPIAAVRAREDDLFVPELERLYQRRVVELPGVGYLHFLERRP